MSQGQNRHRKARPPRPKWPLAVVVGIVALSLVSVLAWWIRGGDTSAAPTPSGSPSATAPAVQQTLLVQVSDDEGVAINNLLLSTYESGGRSASIGVQPQLLVTAPGAGQITFGRTVSLPGGSASADSLSDLLGVRVDGTWSLGRLAFSALVDSVGGVEVEVPEAILERNADGSVRFALSKGFQTLDGPQAALYVQVLLPGEVEAARIARFQEVFRQIEVRLPPDKLRVEALLGSLGALSQSTVPTEQLAAFLLSLRADVNLDRLTTADLPTTPVDIGDVDALRLDFVAAASLVDKLLPGAKLSVGPDSPVRVLVQNGVGTPGLGAAAREQLVAAGMVYIAGGNAEKFGYTESLVLISADDPGATAWAAQVTTALRLPATAVRASTTGQTVADVVVILGADYKPLAPPSPEPSIS